MGFFDDLKDKATNMGTAHLDKLCAERVQKAVSQIIEDLRDDPMNALKRYGIRLDKIDMTKRLSSLAPMMNVLTRPDKLIKLKEGVRERRKKQEAKDEYKEEFLNNYVNAERLAFLNPTTKNINKFEQLKRDSRLYVTQKEIEEERLSDEWLDKKYPIPDDRIEEIKKKYDEEKRKNLQIEEELIKNFYEQINEILFDAKENLSFIHIYNLKKLVKKYKRIIGSKATKKLRNQINELENKLNIPKTQQDSNDDSKDDSNDDQSDDSNDDSKLSSPSMIIHYYKARSKKYSRKSRSKKYSRKSRSKKSTHKRYF